MAFEIVVGDRVRYIGPDQKQMHGPLEGVVRSTFIGARADTNCYVATDTGSLFVTSHQYLELVEEGQDGN